jgi:dTDP-4-dehydrorhamnose 3,5-epimerase
MIHGVTVTPLKQIFDERGKVMRMLRADDPHFTQFGEIYFSCIYPNVVKAWHLHNTTTLNYAVQELFLGPDNYCLVTVPPLIWNGFKGYGTEMAFLANCASLPHEPSQISRRQPFDPTIPYDWNLKHG